MTTRVDMHIHIFPLLNRGQAQTLDLERPSWLRDNGDGSGFVMAGDEEYRPVESPLWDPVARLAQMDATGVDVQVMSATPILFSYAAPVANAVRWAAMINDMALEMCSADSTRLRTLCQVPLQDLDAACAEAARSCRAGHVGVHIGNHVGGRNLDDPEMVGFLAFCSEQGIPVLVHQWDMMAAERMPRYRLKWMVGMPAETHLAILSLDSAVFSDDALRLLTAVMGDDHIMMGSDSPFPLGDIEPGRLISDSSHLDVGAKTRMLGGNAARFFGLGLTDV